MKPGDLVRLKCNTSLYNTSVYSTPFEGRTEQWDEFGNVFVTKDQVSIFIAAIEHQFPGCSRTVLILAPGGTGWISEHFLEAVE